jgi:hypothetical protein
MKKIALLSLVLFSPFGFAQNRLYVRVEYNPSMQLLGFGGSGFFYDHIFLLPDGTAFRFDDVSDDSEQVLPSSIKLTTATIKELANAGGAQGTYQDNGTTVTTSFGVSFASAGEEYSSVTEESGYMFIPPLQPSFITGEYNNFSATVIGGGLTNTPQVSAGESNNYFFYGDGKFGFEESSGVSGEAGGVATTFSSEDSAAGSFLFEGYNLFLTYNDGTQAVLPAYLWPPYQSFEDQILMVGEDEFLNEEESSISIQLLPANGASTQQGAQNPLGATPQGSIENPLAQPSQGEGTNPLAQPTEPPQTTEQNPLATPQQPTTASPNVPSQNALSGMVTPPADIILSNALVIACPYEAVNEESCVNAAIDAAGTYRLELPAGDYIVMAAMDATGDGQVNTGDYVSYQSFSSTGEAQNLDFVLEPYSE